MSDRTEFETARQIGLERRQEQRLARATFTAAEVKVLTETASKVAYALGRKDAGEDVADLIFGVCEEVGDGEQREMLHDLAVMARSIASQPPLPAPEPSAEAGGYSDLPQTPKAPQEDI